MAEVRYVAVLDDKGVVVGAKSIEQAFDKTEIAAGHLGRTNKTTESSFANMGGIMNTVKGTAASLGIGLTALGAINIAKDIVGSAIQFEASFAGVKKTVDTAGMSAEASAAQFNMIQRELREMALEIPVSVNELNKIAELRQMGIAADAIVEFTKTVATMAATTNLSSDQAATAFGQISNIMGTATEDFGLGRGPRSLT